MTPEGPSGFGQGGDVLAQALSMTERVKLEAEALFHSALVSCLSPR